MLCITVLPSPNQKGEKVIPSPKNFEFLSVSFSEKYSNGPEIITNPHFPKLTKMVPKNISALMCKYEQKIQKEVS